MAHGSLAGVRICLSAELSDDMRPAPGIDPALFVRELAEAVFREGGYLVHGSHPSIVPVLARAAAASFPDGGAADRLTLVRSARHSTDRHAAEIEAQRAFARVEPIPARPTTDEVASRADVEDLVPMRDWMADRCDVVVALGGRWYDRDKERAGIPIEIDAFLDRGKPAFVITACGGAAAGYLAADPSLFSRLHNGLDASANEGLNAALGAARRNAAGVGTVARRIVRQIALLPLAARRLQVRPAGGPATAAASTRPAGDETPRDRFRILCLDGGGIRGAFTAAVLATWDGMMPRGADAPTLIDRFDLVAGTSTGSILAAGLAMGLSPGRLVDLYRDHAARIFPARSGWAALFSRKYDTAPLREALVEQLGGRTLDRARRPLVIPAVLASRGAAVLITTPHAQDRTADRSMTAVDAVLASAAAPTFFAEATVDGPIATGRYIDGGLWANNPVLPAIAEAVGHLGTSPDRIDVLSVGTMATTHDFHRAHGGGLAQWGPRVSDLFFAAQESGAEQVARTILGEARLLRVNGFSSVLDRIDDGSAVERLSAWGQEVGRDTFASVRGRFLEGPPAPAWTPH